MVPSVRQSSTPFTPSSAAKYTSLLIVTKFCGNDGTLDAVRLMSFTSDTAEVEITIFDGSCPVDPPDGVVEKYTAPFITASGLEPWNEGTAVVNGELSVLVVELTRNNR